MKPVVVYPYPLDGQQGFFDRGFRFMESYHANPPGIEHDSIVVCNGAKCSFEAQMLFGTLQGVRFFEYDNSGYDCGAYQYVARNLPAEMLVFFGSSAYLKGAGWLKRMVEAREQHGDTLYGTHGNTGVPQAGVQAHVRTTGFFMSSALLNAYPMIVSNPGQRYPFEHGPGCLTSWCYSRGLQVWVVAWSGEYQLTNCNQIPNGYHSGDQSGLLCGDRNTEPPFFPIP